MESAAGKTGVEQASDAMGWMAVQQVTGRMVIQQCLSAELKLKGADGVTPEIIEVNLLFIVVSYPVN